MPGHGEGDRVFGQHIIPAATLVERSTRFLLSVGGLPGGTHQADPVADALAAAITTPPRQLAKSLTGDLGHEMAQHQRFTIETGVRVFFCDPNSPRQRRRTRACCSTATAASQASAARPPACAFICSSGTRRSGCCDQARGRAARGASPRR